MIGNEECWAIIPARTGSKGLPGKNVRMFAGKPLLAWSIKQAQDTKCVDRVIVSSDGVGTLAIAREYGAHGHLRAQCAATDGATVYDVLRDCLVHAADGPKWIAVFQPTNPMRTDGIVDMMANTATETDASMVMTAQPDGISPWLSWQGHLGSIIPVAMGKGLWHAPRQSLPSCYVPNGNAWLMDRDFAIDPNPLRPRIIVVPFIEDHKYHHDINTLEDFDRIERVFLERHGMGEPVPHFAEAMGYPD